MAENSQNSSFTQQAIKEKLFAAERHISILRLILIGFNSAVYLLWMRDEIGIPILAYSIIAIANSYSIFGVLYRPYEKYSLLQSSYVTTIVDGILTAAWIAATGMVNSPFYLIWYVSVIAVAMRYSLKETTFASFVYVILYSAVVFMDNDTPIQNFTLISRLGYIPIAGLLGMYFSREMSDQIDDKIKTKEAEADLKKAKGELELRVHERTAELEEKNLDITSSINYAQRIQKAVIPDFSDLQKKFPDSFVYFQPRDIVSGDFYWFHQTWKETIIVAADCTGHGVPGGFMSMLGIELLKNIVINQSARHPSLILELLDDGLYNTLHKTQVENMNDGMDLAICRIDHKNKEIHYAGAGNPLIRIHNKQLEYHKGSKIGVGGGLGLNILYETHTFTYEKGDMIYLFSDGYVDQFGRENNKKLMTKRLKVLLQEIHSQPADQQQEKIHQYFLDWKGAEPQVDDVLVMGVRL